MKKVLIIRLGAIGDVVETTGLIRALKKIGCEVDYLTGKAPATLLENMQAINKLFVFEKKNYSYIFKLGLKLAKEKYDVVLNLQPSLRLKTLAFLTGAKKKVNYKKSYKFHAVENFFQTGKEAFPEIELDKNIYLDIDNELKEKMLSKLNKDKLKICFNTGASAARQGRKWNLDNWVALAELIYQKYDAEIFIIGAKEDKDMANQIIAKVPQIKSFVDQTTLPETAALLSCSDVVISGDTGPLHIATASKTRCIGLFGSNSVSRSGPYGENHLTIASDLECAPCDKRKCKYTDSIEDDTPCMINIKPQKVLDLVDILIKKI